MLRSEEEARNKYFLRSNRKSNTLAYLPAITFNLKKNKRKKNRIVKLVGRYLISIEKCCINIFCQSLNCNNISRNPLFKNETKNYLN